jgi:hypothetical protein
VGFFLELGSKGLTTKDDKKLYAGAGGPFKPNTNNPAKPVLKDIFHDIVQPAVVAGKIPKDAPAEFVRRMKEVFGDKLTKDQIQTAWEKAISPSSREGRHPNDQTVLGQVGETEMCTVLTGPGYNLKFVGYLQNKSGHGVDGVFLSQDGKTLYIVDAKASNGSDYRMSDIQADEGPRGYAELKVKEARAEEGAWDNNPLTLWNDKLIPAKEAARELQALLDSHKGRGAVVGLKVEVPCNNDVPIPGAVRVKKGNSTEWDLSDWIP